MQQFSHPRTCFSGILLSVRTQYSQRTRYEKISSTISKLSYSGGFKCILLVPNLRLRLCCCLCIKIVKIAWRLPNYCNVSSQRNNLIKLTHYEETKKTHDSHIIRAKVNLYLRYGGPSQDKHQAPTNQPIKALHLGPHCV